jgi:hypothetical protein
LRVKCAASGGKEKRLKLVFRKPSVHPVDAEMLSCFNPGQKIELSSAQARFPHREAGIFAAKAGRIGQIVQKEIVQIVLSYNRLGDENEFEDPGSAGRPRPFAGNDCKNASLRSVSLFQV